jgi:acetylornithine deacetylase/succinyl-diaminopimelate desuccinylase family protein
MLRKNIPVIPFDGLIGPDEVLRLSRELIRIPSVHTKEHAIAKFIHGRLDRWGFSPRYVQVDGYGPDVVAELGAKNDPSVIFNGHMDTVDVAEGWKHNPFEGKVENGLLYGLGSLDMKCGLAAIMLAFRTLAESRRSIDYRVCFQAATGEELTGAGTMALIKHGEFRRAKAVIVGEGFGGFNAVTNGRRGGSYYDVEVTGKSAHGAQPHLGVNAVIDASKIIVALDDMDVPNNGGLLGDDFRPLKDTQLVQKISGGGSSLTVPERCTFTVVRSTMPGSKIDATRDIKRAIDRLGLRSRVTVKLRTGLMDPYYPYITPVRSELVRIARKVVTQATGKSPKLVCGVSEADDNLIARYTKVPVISVGPGESGDLARYHQSEEAITISQLQHAPSIYARMASIIGGSKPRG